MLDKLAVVRSLVSVDEHSDSLVMTGYSESDNRTADHPSFGSVVSKLRGGGQRRRPAVRQPARHERRHRAGLPRRRAPAVHAGRARACRTCGWPAASTAERHGRPQGPARRRSTRSAATSTPAARWTGMDAFTGRAFDMVASGAVRKALDLKQRRPAGPRPLQGRRAVPDGPPAGRGGRRLRHARLRRLGHARQQLQDAEAAAAASSTAASPT